MKTTAPCVQTGCQHPIHMHTVSPFFFFLLTVYLPAHTARMHHLLTPTTHHPLPVIRMTVMLWGMVAPALAAQWLAATTTRALTVADSLLQDGLPIAPTPSASATWQFFWNNLFVWKGLKVSEVSETSEVSNWLNV